MPEPTDLSLTEVFGTGQIRLAQLSVYNWGSFQGLHTARIDPEGTLITGDNGAGKSTLIDGLMALLLPSGRASFNIAAAQGDRTDRTLMSYVRGNYGKAHDGNQTATLLKRAGATATGLRALYQGEDGSKITLAVLFWITQPSNALKDLKHLYIVGKRDLALEEVLHIFGEGNTRMLKQYLNEDPLLESFESFTEYQELYMRLLRMENRNAPALLSRALGLKKIDDLTSLIRDLVLEPSQVKEHARSAVSEFDDLVSIHHELEDARQQRDALLGLPKMSEELEQARAEMKGILAELSGLPIYFAEQCAGLWQARLKEYEARLLQLAQHMQHLEDLATHATERTQLLFHAYQSQGGERLEVLRKDLETATEFFETATRNARNYQMDARRLDLACTLTLDTFNYNKTRAQKALADMPAIRQATQDNFASSAAHFSGEQARLKSLESQIHQISSRPDSNIDPAYQQLRDQLVESLSLDRDQLMFVGELLDVRDDQRHWHGAIERALGGLRITLLVPDEQHRLVTRWLNARNTGLHVRVQVVEQNQHAPTAQFLPDGFLRKLEWKTHPYRDWLKRHLSRFDLHCVDSTETLDQTDFSMTIQGLVHLNNGRFEKKDQQRIDDPRYWCLGFSNKSRLATLQTDRSKLEAELITLGKQVESARLAMDDLDKDMRVWERIGQTAWASIDVQSAQKRRQSLEDDLQALEQPDSELGAAKSRWEQACIELRTVQEQQGQVSKNMGGLENNAAQAQQQLEQAYSAASPGLPDQIRELLSNRIGTLFLADLDTVGQIQGHHRSALDELHKRTHSREIEASTQASGIVSRFKTKWPVVSNDWLTGLEGLEEYIDHLAHLESEGLPDLVEQFRERLNRNATQSLARISQAIQAEREDIQDRIDTINDVLERTEFRLGTYLRLGSRPEVFEHVKTFNSQLVRVLARAGSDDHEARFGELKELVEKLEKATNPATAGNMESLRLLDSRYQLSFFAEEIEKDSKKILDVLESSSGKSGGEKESFAGTIVAASLAYVLTPDGSDRPLYCTVFLDEAFSNTAEAVSRRVLKVFSELRIHVNLITPYKNLNLARESARSLLIAERDPARHESRLCEVTWEDIDKQMAIRKQQDVQAMADSLGIQVEPSS